MSQNNRTDFVVKVHFLILLAFILLNWDTEVSRQTKRKSLFKLFEEINFLENNFLLPLFPSLPRKFMFPLKSVWED